MIETIAQEIKCTELTWVEACVSYMAWDLTLCCTAKWILLLRIVDGHLLIR